MKRTNLSRQTAETLYNQIVIEGRIGPGEKLPNEMELSRELGVSRATLREALRDLITQGVLEVRRGKGTYVAKEVAEIEDFGFAQLNRTQVQLRDLFELRSIFEPKAAALACKRATDSELEDILHWGQEVECCILQGEDRALADRAFHTAMVRAAHNEFMLRLLPVIDRAVKTAIDAGANREQLAQDTLRDHALLLEFVSKRDAEGAEHAMAIHIRHSMDVMELGAE